MESATILYIHTEAATGLSIVYLKSQANAEEEEKPNVFGDICNSLGQLAMLSRALKAVLTKVDLPLNLWKREFHTPELYMEGLLNGCLEDEQDNKAFSPCQVAVEHMLLAARDLLRFSVVV
ncbi:hypothetical protein PG994_000699 [Apiospora phragmitis]|uniref:Uncharacterized protein n=1 Tax=Apiospora phragmitis TaxID=2905665 RepID=A0ABR1X705_9PEZI